MVTFIRANGKMVKQMVLACSLTQMDLCIRESGSMIYTMERAAKPGTTTLSNTKGSSLKAKKQVKEDLNLIIITTKVTLLMGSSMASENITSPILARLMRVSSKKIISLARD